MKKVKPKITSTIRALLKQHKHGIKLDVGCGDAKQSGFVGIDFRKTKSADIVHNAEVVPYPLPDECCSVILCSHLVEHLKPWLMIDIMNEWWRLLEDKGQLWLSMPYAGSFGFWQDPTHIKSWNEATATYYDPREFLYEIYKPRPWLIKQNNWIQTGNIEIILQKMTEEEGKATYEEARKLRAERGVSYGK